jgi:hypothetical protein
MSSRRRLPAFVLVAVAVLVSTGASARTTNFLVHAPTPQIAQQVGQYAEHYRKQKAIEWLGYEMPTWPQPCPLHVHVTMEGPSGATTFLFGPQGATSMRMDIRGPLDRLLSSVLPHEVTHTVFAHYFKRAVPRWADEGGSVLSEDDIELDRHDKLVRSILNRGQQYRLRNLMTLKDYPDQRDRVVCLYAQGFSLAHYLVHISDKQTYLRFVAHGMARGWDSAVQTHYRMRNVEELEGAWLQHLRDSKGVSIMQLAQRKREQGQPVAQADPAKRTVVRLTVPPVQPLEAPVPVVRGVAPEEGRPGYLPDYPRAAPAQDWHPAPVQLRPPEFGPPPAGIGQPVPQPMIGQPVPAAGFPRP